MIIRFHLDKDFDLQIKVQEHVYISIFYKNLHEYIVTAISFSGLNLAHCFLGRCKIFVLF